MCYIRNTVSLELEYNFKEYVREIRYQSMHHPYDDVCLILDCKFLDILDSKVLPLPRLAYR